MCRTLYIFFCFESCRSSFLCQSGTFECLKYQTFLFHWLFLIFGFFALHVQYLETAYIYLFCRCYASRHVVTN